MKLRYQMRGLGIGIIVTALLMGVATKEGRPLTDAEIKAKAYELGMVDSDSVRLTDLKGSTPIPQGTLAPPETAVPQETLAPPETAVPQETLAPPETAAPQETLAPQGTAVPTAIPATEPTTVPEPGNNSSEEAVTIVIRQGANSYSVSVQLEEAGLIENASEFDSYLCQNGYSSIIRIGVCQIVPGTSEEEIAKIITGTG